MKLEEAWEFSATGTAIGGDAAMMDILWQRGDTCPAVWITRGYKHIPELAERFKNEDWWNPANPRYDFVKFVSKKEVTRENGKSVFGAIYKFFNNT